MASIMSQWELLRLDSAKCCTRFFSSRSSFRLVVEAVAMLGAPMGYKVLLFEHTYFTEASQRPLDPGRRVGNAKNLASTCYNRERRRRMDGRCWRAFSSGYDFTGSRGSIDVRPL